MNTQLMLKVDPNLTFSINTQIKEQLKWLIGIGQFKPGDMLPPANQLAELLRINRNTVNLVYTQLRDEGIVSMQKGRGTQILSGPKIEELQNKRVPMFSLLKKTIDEAIEQDINLEELFTASLAFILFQNAQPSSGLRILFVECKEHDHYFYKREIERVTGAEVKTVFLEDLLLSESVLIEALEYSNVVVTTLNHATEVKKQFARYEKHVFSVGATVEMSLLLDIAKIKPGSKVSFVCLGKKGGQWMAHRVEDAGISQIECIPVGFDDQQQLLKAIKESDKIYATAAVFDKVNELAPNKVTLFPMQLEMSSENMLKELSVSSNG